MKKRVAVLLIFVMLLNLFTVLDVNGTMSVSAQEVVDDYSRCESFEGAQVPNEWQAVNGGTIALSQNHYKHGTHSLRWDWTTDSKIRVNEPPYLTEVGAKKKRWYEIMGI